MYITQCCILVIIKINVIVNESFQHCFYILIFFCDIMVYNYIIYTLQIRIVNRILKFLVFKHVVQYIERHTNIYTYRQYLYDK